MKFNFVLILFFILNSFFSIAFSSEKKGQLTGDFVRSREEPNLNSPVVGFFHKYMIVKIIEKSKEKMRIGKSEEYWYKISRENLTGWIYGSFLDLELQNKDKGLFYGNSDMGWFLKRFSKCYFKKNNLDDCNISFLSFSQDDFRNLIAAAKSGSIIAVDALKRSAGFYFSRYETEEKFEYLKKGFKDSGIYELITKKSFSKDKKLILKKIKKNPKFLKYVSKKQGMGFGVFMVALSTGIAIFLLEQSLSYLLGGLGSLDATLGLSRGFWSTPLANTPITGIFLVKQALELCFYTALLIYLPSFLLTLYSESKRRISESI